MGEAFIGRVVDALGRPIDGKGDLKTTESRLIESPPLELSLVAPSMNRCKQGLPLLIP